MLEALIGFRMHAPHFLYFSYSYEPNEASEVLVAGKWRLQGDDSTGLTNPMNSSQTLDFVQ